MSELTPNLKLFKYNTETDAKQPFSINDCMNANWDKIDASLGSLEICDIGMALYVDETKGLRRYLNGQIVDINTNTQAFLDRLKDITTLHPSLLCTEEEWQTAKTMSAFGQVGKFVFNYSGENIVSVRIPAIVNVQGLFDLQNLGMTVGAGLPNITGSASTTAIFNNTRNQGGTVGAITTAQTGTIALSSGGGQQGLYSLSFNASEANSTYGNSNTVQPEAIQYPYFIQIATGAETENNIINDIELNNPYSLFDSKYSDHELNNLSWLKSEGQWNSKAVYTDAYDKLLKVYNGTETVEGLSVKLSTETYTGYDFVLNTAEETFRLPLKTLHTDNTVDSLLLYYYVGETVQNANLIDAGRIGEQLASKVDLDAQNLSAEGKSLISGFGMPSDKHIDLTLGAGGSSYTAPANGWFSVSGTTQTGLSYIYLANTNANIRSQILVNNVGSVYPACFLPAKKGQIITLSYGRMTGLRITFTYATGSESEVN